MKFRYFLFSLLFIVACGKDEPDIPEYYFTNNGKDTTAIGTGDPGTTPTVPTNPTEPNPPLTDTYQPLTKNSFWKYAEVDENKDTSWVTTTLTGKTITEGGKQFYEAKNEYEGFGQDGITYFHTANGIYTYRSEEGFSGEYQNFEYLRSTLAVNAGWEVSMGKNPVTDFDERLVGSIKAKGIKKTVLDREYKDVIQTELVSQNKIMNTWITVMTYKFYIAKGIGIIEKEATFGEGTASIVIKQYLASYSIAK